jgi:hypothetical protein
MEHWRTLVRTDGLGRGFLAGLLGSFGPSPLLQSSQWKAGQQSIVDDEIWNFSGFLYKGGAGGSYSFGLPVCSPALPKGIQLRPLIL